MMRSIVDIAPIAQVSQTQDLSQFFTVIIAIIAIGLIGGVAVWLLKRHYLDRPDQNDASAGTGGLMSELRNLRDQGEITDEEYERTRKLMAARAAGLDEETIKKLTADLKAARSVGVLEAPPGFDLTGQPLPTKNSGPDTASDKETDPA